MPSLESDNYLFEALQEPFNTAFNDHINKSKRSTISLNPYELVPDVDYPIIAEEYYQHLAKWEAVDIEIEHIVHAVTVVNMGTEANLPWYTTHVEQGFAPWRPWNARWTTEESSHERVMERDVAARGILNMTHWHKVREQNMNAGIHVRIESLPDGLAYVATQELLTREAHFSSARIMDDRMTKTLHAIGIDEGRHYQFYVTMLRALGEVDPDAALLGMQRQHQDGAFEMPGQQGIKGYKQHAAIIAAAGLFDEVTVLEAQKQTIDNAGLLKVTAKTDEGKQAQEWAAGISEKSDEIWDEQEGRMERLRAMFAKRIKPGELRPFILGHTVELNAKTYQPIAA